MAKIDWAKQIEAWQASGLSQAAFCRQQGLNPNTFSGRVGAQRRLPPSDAAVLLPVRVEPPASGNLGVVLCLSRGHRLELPASVSPGWLAELLQCLG